MQEKEKLRQEYLNQRSKLSKKEIIAWSRKITKKFLNLSQLSEAVKIMSYASMKNEIKTFVLMEKLLENNYLLYLPYTCKEEINLGVAQINDLNSDLKKGVYGVQEPIKKLRTKKPPSDLDIIIVPALCYTKSGYRIGYGGGYYDSFLSKHGQNSLKIGFCYDKFIVDSIPIESHDVPVDIIITENRVIKAN